MASLNSQLDSLAKVAHERLIKQERARDRWVP